MADRLDHAGVVDEMIEPAEAGDGGGDRGGNLGGV
jgi:hypothetical protein